jgi:L-lactate dehydrogenase complex protein LldG
VSGAREEVLARVRRALRDVPPGEDLHVTREYSRGFDGSAVELFAQRVADYEASVHRVAPEDLAATITDVCGGRCLAIPPDLPREWRPGGVKLLEDTPLSNEELDSLDGALTGCALAIAETGTIVLDSGPRQGRRALTLIPDWHVCVVEEDRVVGSLPQAIDRLEQAVREGRPITFISGPSATSDIELERVAGVHGPRTLDVLLVAPLSDQRGVP